MLQPLPRVRNAAVTRAALLEAARRRFATFGYDGTSLRDVAADAGVDAALVSRYFGSKDELFTAVLSALEEGDWMQGEGEFGPRLAEALVQGDCGAECMDPLLVLLRSIGASRAQEPLRAWCDETFHGPLKQALGAQQADDASARLAGALVLGVAVSRMLREDLGLCAEGRARFEAKLAELLQTCAAAPKS